MAMYKDGVFLTQSHDGVFDGDNHPGSAASRSGIYRCMGCGREITSEENHPLPPQNHHQHGAGQGSIRWRLIVYADHRPK